MDVLLLINLQKVVFMLFMLFIFIYFVQYDASLGFRGIMSNVEMGIVFVNERNFRKQTKFS